MYNKSILTFLCIVLITSVFLSACNSKASRQMKEADKVIKVPAPETYGEEGSAVKKMYDRFMKKHPDIYLEEVTVQDMNVALAAGKAPDLLVLENYKLMEQYKLGNIEPLDKYYKEYGWNNKIFKWASNSVDSGDKKVGLPWNFEGLMLVYNKTLFKQKGWKVPTNYKELLNVSKKIKAEGLMPISWGTSNAGGIDDWVVAEMVNSVLGPKGAKELFSGNEKWSNPEMQKSFERYSKYWNAGNMTDKKSHAISLEDSMQLFATGKAAMRLDGTWSLATDLGNEFKIGYAPFPSFKNSGHPVIPLGVGGSLAINKHSKYKDEVAELIDSVFQEDILSEMAQKGAPMPVDMDYGKLNVKSNVADALTLIVNASKNQKNGYLTWTYASPSVVGVLESEMTDIYLKPKRIPQLLKKLDMQKEKDRKEGNLYDINKY